MTSGSIVWWWTIYILDLKLESQSDFRHYVTEESELEKALIH